MAVITNPFTGEKLTNLTAEGVMNLAFKIAESRFSGAGITSKYPDLERGVTEYGAILEEVRFPAVESQAIDPNTTTKIAPAYPNPTALYFKKWTEKRYPVEWRIMDAQKVVNGEMDFGAFVAAAINAAAEGYRLDVNDNIKNAFMKQGTPSGDNNAAIWLTADGTVSTANQSILGKLGHYEVLNAGATFEDVYNEIQRVAMDMQFPNATYTDAFKCSAEMGDLVCVVPTAFMAGANTRYLSDIKNLEKAEAIPKLIMTDGCTFAHGGKTGCVILIMDKRFMQHVERYRGTVAGEDRDRVSRYNDLIVEDGIPVFPCYKAYAIVFDLPDAAKESVVVNA